MSTAAVKRGEGWRLVIGSVLFALLLTSLAGCVYLLRDTLTAWWKPLLVVWFVATALYLPLRRPWSRLLHTENLAAGIVCHLLVALPVLLCAALLVNYLGSRGGDSQTVMLKVERVYNKTHYRSKRVSRRVYTRGAPYKVYYIEAAMPDGKNREFQVTHKTYKTINKGDTALVEFRKGLLGMPVIDHREIRPLHPRKERKPRWPGPKYRKFPNQIFISK